MVDDLVGRVARGVVDVQRPVAEVDGAAAFDLGDALLRDWLRVDVKLPLVADGALRALDEPGRIDEVGCPDGVDVHLGVRACLDQESSAAGVVEVDVGERDDFELPRGDSHLFEGGQNPLDVGAQSRVDDGRPLGVDDVHRAHLGDVEHAGVDDVAVPDLACGHGGDVSDGHVGTPAGRTKSQANPWRRDRDGAATATRFSPPPVNARGMLGRQYLREHADAVREAVAARGTTDVDVEALLELDERWRELKARGDDLRHERNQVSSKVGELKQAGDEEAAEEAIQRSSALKADLEDVEDEADELEAELESRLLEIPNVPHESVPVGDDEADNVEERRHGFSELRDLPADVVPHYELGERLQIIDEARGAKTTGAGFYFLKGDGARLEHALIQFMLDVHREQGYVDLFPPVPVTSASMTGTGQLPKFADDAYRVGGSNDEPYGDDDLWLCPTAEVPVTNMYADEILLAEDLPLKHQAYTPNFRREAGEHGVATRGIVRVHQFNKVEMVNFVRPDESEARFEGLVDEAEEVLRRLDLPYRILEMCTGDLGFTQRKKYDIEVWAPADDMADGPEEGGRWLEVSSVSNFGAFQARRAGLRYRPERHESAEYLHTLNGSGLAIPRIVVAILEYYQNDDGTVTVPEVLRPYLGGTTIIDGHDPVGESALGAGESD